MLPADYKPYFMSNKDWFYYDEKDNYKLKLTDKAPPEAVKSYKEHYEMMRKLRFEDYDE